MKTIYDSNDKRVTMPDLCHLIYQGFGQSAVIAFCDNIGWQTWQVCDACETESPISDDPETEDICLVCWSKV